MENTIHREISRILFEEVKDERLKYVTITTVRLTTDLSYATIYYRVIGNEEQISSTKENIQEAKGFIRKMLSGVLKVKRVPDLIFKYDESIEYGERIDKIIEDIKDN
ncbi:MAG: 30S ribosome-binding factor RbfA [Bacilli bacterium]|nr:30S ribosome-binding factor RbfA [Bacilli bacterium]MDD3120847.1 30S ribosome-binding factor RbfA [Bacilli bacterium]MDD4063042.1 30S ribosome-binding factor RbfA [Bacilli bacterium]MDD4481678.1 30S ribosome-binding factor RbfA [Bacilli bacterium]MDD5182549.1 30S ribosome-binding factor RbfA [Bacilli bacterium]